MADESRYVLSGRDEIAQKLGVSPRRVSYLINHEGLPAFRPSGNGPWVCLPEDLQTWLREYRDRHLQHPAQG